MFPRLLAFALASVVGMVPTVAQICEIRCAAHLEHALAGTGNGGAGGHDSGDISHHHHHGVMPQQNAETGRPAVSPSTSRLSTETVGHGCIQLDAVLTESREIVRSNHASAIVPATPAPAIASSVAVTSAPDSPDTRHGRGSCRSISQLRV